MPVEIAIIVLSYNLTLGVLIYGLGRFSMDMKIRFQAIKVLPGIRHTERTDIKDDHSPTEEEKAHAETDEQM